MDLFQFQFCSNCTTLKSQPIHAGHRCPYIRLTCFQKYLLYLSESLKLIQYIFLVQIACKENQWEFCFTWNFTVYTYSLVSRFSLSFMKLLTWKYPSFTIWILCIKIRIISIHIFCIINNIKVIFSKFDSTFLDPFIKFWSQYWLSPFNINCACKTLFIVFSLTFTSKLSFNILTKEANVSFLFLNKTPSINPINFHLVLDSFQTPHVYSLMNYHYIFSFSCTNQIKIILNWIP